MHLSRTTAIGFAGRGIRINCVLPRAMQTPMVVAAAQSIYGHVELEAIWARRNAEIPVGVGEGWDVASAVVYLASDDARHVTLRRSG